MSGCVICTEASVATTATSTTMEAFPFLCAQVGLTPTGRQGPVGLCSTCHALWEEVTLLYANMQGLLNLMGRRVTSIKQRVKVTDGNSSKTYQTRRQGKRGRISTVPDTPSATRPEVMMNWWYPQPAGSHNNIENSTIEESDPVIKLESVDFNDSLGEELMDLEDVEIMPDPGHENGEDDDEDDDLNDPSYDPIGDDDEATTSRSNPEKPKPTRPTFIPLDYPPIETLTSEKGRPMVMMNNFLYNFRSTAVTLGKSVWECKVGRCGVRLHTTDDPTQPKFIHEINTHKHAPVEGGILLKRVKTKIRTAALTTTDTPAQIIKQFRLELDAAYAKNGRKLMVENIRRKIQRIRKFRDAAGTGSLPSGEEV